MKDLIKKKAIGMSRDGSRFMVLNSLIFKMLIPEAAIRKPPTIDNSVINSAEMKLSRDPAKR